MLILKGIPWSFNYGKISSIEVFRERLYDEDISIEDYILPSMSNIELLCEYIDKEDEEHIVRFALIADNRIAFSCEELLFKIHNELVDILEDNDYHFFEGLLLVKDSTYEVMLGN